MRAVDDVEHALGNTGLMRIVRDFGFRSRGWDETWCASCTRRMAAEGTRSDGFKMYELPGDALASRLEEGRGEWADREGYG